MRKHNIMLIDDDENYASWFESVCRERHLDLIVVPDGQNALKVASRILPSAIVLSMDLPGGSSSGTCKFLKHNRLTQQIPLVIVSDRDDFSRKTKADHAFLRTHHPHKILDAVESAFGESKRQQVERIQRIASLPVVDKAKFIFIAIVVTLILLLTLLLRWGG